jgi:hypothetical protein
MNLLPCPAQFVQVVHQDAWYAPDLTPLESVVLPEIYRSGRTVQIEYRFATRPNRVDVGRPMIVRIDHYPQPAKSENRRHKSILPGFLSAWVQREWGCLGFHWRGSPPDLAGNLSDVPDLSKTRYCGTGADVIQTDDQVLLAQQCVANLRRILLEARKVHSATDYLRLSEPILLEVQQREQEILEYLSGSLEQPLAS